MPRKKTPSKSSVETTKQPVALEIKPHHANASPHVLNLRSISPPPLPEPPPQTPPSLEERVAAFDERIREVPDLLKARAEGLAKLWSEERREWEATTTSFFERATAWGAQVRGRLKEKRKTRNVRMRAVPRPRFHLAPPITLRYSSFSHFAVLLIALTLPLQGLAVYRAIDETKNNLSKRWDTVIANLEEGISSVSSGKTTEAGEAFRKVAQETSAFNSKIDRFGRLRSLLPQRLEVAAALLGAAEAGARATSTALDVFERVKGGQATPGTFISTLAREVHTLSQEFFTLLGNRTLAPALEPFRHTIIAARDLTDVAQSLASGERHILLVFQNPRELRATGGFAGSFALLTLKDGRIEQIEAPEAGTYAVQGQLKLPYLSPRPLHLINTRFEFQDANWWPNFPTSAQKIAELYEAAGGPTVDMVVALTAEVGAEILRRTGPLTSPEGTLSAENFIDILQQTIARDRASDRTAPKKIIIALLPAIWERTQLFARQKPKELLTTASALLASKDIQLWSRNAGAQAALRRLGFTGELRETAGDYLAIISSNVGGGKTDGVVKEETRHEAQLVAPGVLKATIRIRRTHTGSKDDRVSGLRNISYMRIYVPDGARFLEAGGFTPPSAHLFEEAEATLSPDPDVRASEAAQIIDVGSGTAIWEETGKRVFGNFLTVEAGKTVEGWIRYEVPLPHRREGLLPYTLTIERQAGKQASFSSKITINEDTVVVSGSGEGRWSPTGWNFEGLLDKTLTASGILYTLPSDS